MESEKLILGMDKRTRNAYFIMVSFFFCVLAMLLAHPNLMTLSPTTYGPIPKSSISEPVLIINLTNMNGGNSD